MFETGVVFGFLLAVMLGCAAVLALNALRRLRAAYGWPTSQPDAERQVRVAPGVMVVNGEQYVPEAGEVIIADINWRSRPGRSTT